MDIVPASSISLSSLVTLLNDAFEDYMVPINETVEDFSARIRFNDIIMDGSMIALQKGKAAGLVLLGIRGTEAWIGGMGVKKEFRTKGVGKILAKKALEYAAQKGAKRVSLEVIVGNEAAYSLYRGFGFKEARTLSCYHKNGWKPSGVDDATFKPVEFSWLKEIYDKAHCWQKTYRSMEGVQNLECYGVRFGQETPTLGGNNESENNGYLVLARKQNRVELVDLKPAKALSTALSLFIGEKDEIKAINIHDPALKEELARAGFEEFARQREMRLGL